ncbi:MAG: RNA polymerase sigma factor [Paludibacter sp.]|nr:RNA polymerase sigma factor [Paludibacter sp.]
MFEQEIIKNIVNGDSSKFRGLVEKYQPIVFRTIMGFVHSKEDAEDLTQDVFIAAYQSIQKYQGDAEFSTWLYRIAVNISINHVNKFNRRNVFQQVGDFIQNFGSNASNDRNPEEQTIENEKEKQIKNAIDTLTEKQRTSFILSKYDDLSQKEIAEIMNISEGAVEQHLQRARKNLQQKLASLVGK